MDKISSESQASTRRLVYEVFSFVWLIKLIAGLVDVSQRHIPDYPDAVRAEPYIGQFGVYVVIPGALLAFNLLMLIFRRKLPRWIDFVFAILQIIALLILLFMSGGGI